MDEPSAAELVARARAGDQSAWDAIVLRYQGLIWATVRGFRLDDQEAADVVQTTWLRLVENLASLREPDRLGAWLAPTARRECLRLLRMSGRSIPVGGEQDLPEHGDGPEIDERLLRDERESALARAFARISERCQRLLRVLVSDPAPSYEEVGAALDMPVGSIGPTRQRCLDRLRKEMGGEGYATA